MTRFHPPFKTGDWSGSHCFVVGGGDSLDGFDWRRLEGQPWIGCNCAGFHGPTITLAADVQWVNEYGMDPRITDHPNTSLVWQRVQDDFIPPWPWFTIEACREWNELGLEHGIVRGPDVGLAALNFACLLGADPIYLLGIDMHDEGEEPMRHWHDEYEGRGRDWLQPSRACSRFREHWERRASCALDMAKIVNLNPESSLTCYPRLAWEDVFPRGSAVPESVPEGV